MNRERLQDITSRYAALRIAVVGDFCLDRYLEIDPARAETSIETGLPVYNVVNVRSQPGGAGTILNNLVALGVGELRPVGFCGEDGEGYELQRALRQMPGVRMEYFLQTAERRTFTYCKPLVIHPTRPHEELSRLDSKNSSPTPTVVQEQLIASLREIAATVDAIILLDQVDVRETGVVTNRLLDAAGEIASSRPKLLILGDSRRGLCGWPAVSLKMNRAELTAMTGSRESSSLSEVKQAAAELARKTSRPVFVTLSEEGIIGANAAGAVEHVASLPVRGEIDIVGAGDAVTANLTCAFAAGAALGEALEIAMVASSVVIHQLGTTGTASVAQLRERLVT